MKAKYDVGSAEPVLFHVEGEVDGVPATDLSANALARIAWVRGGQKKTPADVPQDVIEQIRDELAGTGKYRKTPVTPATEVSDDE